MDAQRTRAELITENLANADSTRTPQGGPYRRKDAVFASTPAEQSFAQTFSEFSGYTPQGVSVSEVAVDNSDPERRYLPGHPDADPDGYVAFPKINPAEEMVDLMSASRGYQANVAAISAVKDMIARSMDLFK
jgi:flagellar basal-body rod protein FlgC